MAAAPPPGLRLCQRSHEEVAATSPPFALLTQDTWEWSLVELGGGGVRPSARDFAKLAALPGGRLLLFGGLDASEKRLDDAWIFDSAT